MLKIILAILAAVIAAVLVMALLKPNNFHVERSIVIDAPASALFEQVNDPRKANDWMPWLKADPDAKVVYEGPAAGVGAASYWNGNKNVGEGRMTIVESRPNELVKTKLEFFKPFKGVNTGEFALAQEGAETRLTWRMYGPSNFMSKVMSVFMNCDKMVGTQFKKGLTELKSRLERK